MIIDIYFNDFIMYVALFLQSAIYIIIVYVCFLMLCDVTCLVTTYGPFNCGLYREVVSLYSVACL